MASLGRIPKPARWPNQPMMLQMCSNAHSNMPPPASLEHASHEHVRPECEMPQMPMSACVASVGDRQGVATHQGIAQKRHNHMHRNSGKAHAAISEFRCTKSCMVASTSMPPWQPQTQATQADINIRNISHSTQTCRGGGGIRVAIRAEQTEHIESKISNVHAGHCPERIPNYDGRGSLRARRV